MKLKLIYTITATILFQILPSQPMTYEVVGNCYYGYDYLNLRYVKDKPE